MTKVRFSNDNGSITVNVKEIKYDNLGISAIARLTKRQETLVWNRLGELPIGCDSKGRAVDCGW